MKYLRIVYELLLRDLKRFWYNKVRIVASLVQVVFFLFVLGIALTPNFIGFSGVKFSTFIFPGIIAMTLIFSSFYSAMSIIWDKEYGFFKEVMVAPVPRWSIALGKILGGSIVAIIQGSIMLMLSPMLKIDLSFIRFIQIIAVMLIISMSMAGLGVAIAARMKEIENFQLASNFLIMPMFYLSGALFPIGNLPKWLAIIIYVNPLTYGIDLLRGIMIGINSLPLIFDLCLISVFCLIMLGVATMEFSIVE